MEKTNPQENSETFLKREYLTQGLPSNAEQINQEVAEKYNKYVNPTALNLLRLAGFDKVEWQGKGAIMQDVEGKEYIDCLGGYGVFSLGHANTEVIEAVYAQMQRLPLSSKTFLNKPLADLCEKLASIAPGDLQYTFLCNSGTEAVEAAIKFARMASKRTQIITASGSYHGKTLGALAASGRDVYKTPFAPMLGGFDHVPFGDFAALEAIVSEKTAAVMLEPIQGENGIQVAPDDYFPEVRALCDKFGVLLILDEVQTGLGRTGKMFATEHYGIAPDMMTLAKALGGGVMPIGAVMGTPAVWDAVFSENPYLHTSTFGGGEAACVAALKTLEIMGRDGLAEKAAIIGERLIAGLRVVQAKYPTLVREVRGKGLMIGVEFDNFDIGAIAIGTMSHYGVIAAYTLNAKKVMRFEPPLILSEEQCDKVIAVFETAMNEVAELLAEFDDEIIVDEH
jgi:putrescine aminotransferase